MLTTTKPGKCKFCRKRLEAIGQRLHDECIDPWVEKQRVKMRAVRERVRREAAKQERAHFKARKEKAKRIPDLIAEAQKECNAYIRLRDAGKPCFCCGKPFEADKPGGSMDAGHFRSRGAAPHLRFDERNIFGQRKNCNRPGGTTYAAMRAGAIARNGLACVEALEADNRVHKWQADELRSIRDHYRAKRRALLKERETA